MKTSIPLKEQHDVLSKLSTANLDYQKTYPGDRTNRQPVHTVYGGAQLFNKETIEKMGRSAKTHLLTYAPDAFALSKALGLTYDMELVEKVYQKILQKLDKEPVEDFRVDFEDGFGNRPDDEEDKTAVFAAAEMAKGIVSGQLSPFIGIRIKPFTEDLKDRAVRTLDLFITALAEHSGGKLPENFVVTLPKVSIPEQVKALSCFMDLLEKNTGLPQGSLNMEIMVETTQAIINSKGTSPLQALVAAGNGRCIAAHFGTYDYTASCNITAKYQTMDHPACDFAHQMIKVALAGTGIWLSDGATNVMPVVPHRGDNLSDSQTAENTLVVHRAWKLAYNHIRHSLWQGFYQGWDLHPAQLPVRYAAVYCFFLESYDDAAKRLKNFMEKAAQATLSADVFDDAATGQGLLNFFLSAINCGAVTENEALATGLTLEEFKSRSFYKILKGRR